MEKLIPDKIKRLLRGRRTLEELIERPTGKEKYILHRYRNWYNYEKNLKQEVIIKDSWTVAEFIETFLHIKRNVPHNVYQYQSNNWLMCPQLNNSCNQKEESSSKRVKRTEEKEDFIITWRCENGEKGLIVNKILPQNLYLNKEEEHGEITEESYLSMYPFNKLVNNFEEWTDYAFLQILTNKLGIGWSSWLFYAPEIENDGTDEIVCTLTLACNNCLKSKKYFGCSVYYKKLVVQRRQDLEHIYEQLLLIRSEKIFPNFFLMTEEERLDINPYFLDKKDIIQA